MKDRSRVLITGGAGFVGSNLTEHFLAQGKRVLVFDNLSRPGGGALRNIRGLLARHAGSSLFEFVKGDVSDFDHVIRAVEGAHVVLHVAAQAALTTSVKDPMADFEVNARGTLNVLEAARRYGNDPIVVFISSSAVYGDLSARPIKVVETPTRWEIVEPDYREGINEEYPIGRGGPYGCSKAAADLYCLDYARTFGLRTVVFRMSAAYGPGQHGTEDQGWVAWFLKQAMQKKPVTIYGDGKQVRDVLFITDLIAAFESAIANIDKASGEAYNIGGGKDRTLSLIEMLQFMKDALGIAPSNVFFEDWRPADCPVLYLDTAKARRDLDWEPKVSKDEGIRELYRRLREQCLEGAE